MKKNALCWSAVMLGLALSLGGCSHEGADWKSATAADTTEAYQQFLAQHPKSANAAQAHTRIDQLQEQRDWQAATAADTRDAYEQFLAQHADSKWAQEARIRIENFAQSGGTPAAATAAPSTATPGSKAHAAASPPAPKMATGGSAMAAANAQYVQLGAFSSQAHAQWQWKRLSAKFSKELGALTPRYAAGKSGARGVVRLQVAVGSHAQAAALCGKLKAHGQSCVPVTG
jgi:SPOR domain